jgi:hypothetical protein
MEISVGDTVMYDGSTGINSREYRKGSGIIIVAQRDVLFTARGPEDRFDVKEHEPGGEFFARPDRDGYWPVGKHLPRWLQDRIDEVNNEDIRISVEGQRGECW